MQCALHFEKRIELCKTVQALTVSSRIHKRYPKVEWLYNGLQYKFHDIGGAKDVQPKPFFLCHHISAKVDAVPGHAQRYHQTAASIMPWAVPQSTGKRCLMHSAGTLVRASVYMPFDAAKFEFRASGENTAHYELCKNF